LLSSTPQAGRGVTGITLSSEQLAEARARAEAESLADRVHFELMDYRALDRPFDRIVSVGMFEHVGLNHYRKFFAPVRRCLHPDGVALLHAIGRSTGPSATNSWFAKYTFPGGYSPALSEMMPAVEPAGLVVTDIEILRLHYVETLRHWRRRFAANRDAIAAIYDERFCRMFEFYLAGSELAFRLEGHMVFQMQLARDQEAVPLTRDYIAAAEARAGWVGVPAHADSTPCSTFEKPADAADTIGSSELCSNGWTRQVVARDGGIDALGYRLCLLESMRTRSCRRDLYATPSLRDADPRLGLLAGPAWEAARPAICRTLCSQPMPARKWAD
jgi:SAM-dependent methyltransferase